MNWSNIFYMFGMALTRPSLTMQLTSGVDVFTHVSRQRRTLWATIVTIFSHMTRDISVFVKCDTIFRLFFFKLPHIRTSTFRKVVWLHTEGMVVSIIWVLLQIYFSFQQWKNLENPLRIEKVIAMSLVYYFFGTQYRFTAGEFST